MNDLRREQAPITPQAWEAIDDEAKTTLELTLAGRRLVDFSGPHGWQHSAVSVGRVRALPEAPREGVRAELREVLPLLELRAPFRLARRELEALARGAKAPDLDPVREAARAIALAEDRALFHGYAAAGIEGICEAAREVTLRIPDDYTRYPDVVANALSALRQEGVKGPYAIALGPQCYTGLSQTTTPAGYPVLQHVQKLVDGPLVWAPGLDGAVVLSQRGGDYELVVGRDLSVGYEDHSAQEVELYIEESFTFQVLAPEAAVPLAYGSEKAARPRRKKKR